MKIEMLWDIIPYQLTDVYWLL